MTTHAPHIVPAKLLVGTWAALMVLTVLTVSARSLDVGPGAHLVIALTIATLKASAVVLVFMHLWWDRRFYLLIFMASLLFVLFFVSMVMLDSTAYQPDIAAHEKAVELRR